MSPHPSLLDLLVKALCQLKEDASFKTTLDVVTQPSNSSMKPHPRSKLATGRASGFYQTTFGVWDSTHIMFGPNSHGSSINRDVVLANNQNYNETRDYGDGGKIKVILRPVPVGGKEDNFMFVDLVQQLRAVYFPVAYKSGPQDEDLCTYLMVDFRLRKGVEIRIPSEDKKISLPFRYSTGLGYRYHETIYFNKTATAGEELITLLDCNQIKLSPTTTRLDRHFIRSIDLGSVISDNFGVDVVWSPYEYSSWVLNFMEHSVYLGLGLVPEIGPLLAVSWSIGMQALTNPDAFKAENVQHLSADVLQAIVGTAIGANPNVPKGFKSGGGVKAF
ncbi:MAG: hypothetical protein L6R38_005088 [Xanthoria sp. 2 TBL-2021]|nr:MAG: hypothetical protein L6R38_005088 [Xanthoria sp. 2 TBL-2021]